MSETVNTKPYSLLESANETSAKSHGLKYRPDIDGLRAIAVSAVVAFHAGLGVRGGFTGVDIFFVISGYLIGSLVYRDVARGRFRLSEFYSRRVKRILPALFGVLIFTYIIALLLLSPDELRIFAPTAIAAILSGANLWFWHATGNYFAQKADLNPLLMTWTLGVEEQFYLFLPLLLLLIRAWRAGLQWLCIGGLALLSLITSIWATAHHPGFAFYFLPARAWELGAGVLLAMAEINGNIGQILRSTAVVQAASTLGLALVFWGLFALNGQTPFPGYAAVLPVGGAVLLIFARDGWVNRVLSRRPVVFVGLISYSWYLWHWPLLSFALITSGTKLSKTVGAAIAICSFGCAVLSYQFIERPFRRSTIPISLLFRRYALAAAIMLAIPIGFLVLRGLPQRYPQEAQMESGLKNSFLSDTCLASYSVVRPREIPPCIPAGTGPAVALIGDSHAGAIAPAVRLLASQNNYRMIELNKDDCPPLIGASHWAPYAPGLKDDCTEFNKARFDYLAKHKSIRVVILEAFWAKPLRHAGVGEKYVLDGTRDGNKSPEGSGAALEKGLDAAVNQLVSQGKTVYLMQDSPIFDFDPLQKVRTQLIPPRRAIAGWLGASPSTLGDGRALESLLPIDEQARSAVAQAAGMHPEVHLFDLQRALCSGPECLYLEDGRVLYVDSGHLDSFGGEIAIQGLQLPPSEETRTPTRPLAQSDEAEAGATPHDTLE